MAEDDDANEEAVPGAPPTDDAEANGDDESLPLSAIRERIEAEREAADDADTDPFASVEEGDQVTEAEAAELFEEVDVGDIDGEEVWDAVVEGDADVTDLLGEDAGIEAGVEPTVAPTETPDEHVVDKREYCQRCEYFAAPPTATCTNEGTEIVELVDDEQFRVRGCPKVADEDEALSGYVGEQ